MKKLIILLAISAAYGQGTVSIQTTGYGQLGELLGDRITTVQNLTVAGPIDKSDFDVMRKAIREGVLGEIDLRDARCRDNEIPDEALRMPYEPLWNESPGESPRKSHEWGNAGVLNKELNNFRKIILPTGIERIGKYALAATNIESLELPQSVRILDEGCFLGTNMKSITVGSQIKVISANSFQACPYLRAVTILNPVETLERGSFGLDGLAKIEFPTSFVSDEYAFEFSKIEEVVFNSREVAATYIKNESLKKLVFNEGVETISGNLASGCPNLSVVVFPATLRSIGERAFADDSALRDVYSRSAVSPVASVDAFCAKDGTVPPQATLYVPVGSADTYRNSVGWNLFSKIVEIEDSQFPSRVVTVLTDYKSGQMYDLQGHMADPETARSGIYIRNGKKVVIR